MSGTRSGWAAAGLLPVLFDTAAAVSYSPAILSSPQTLIFTAAYIAGAVFMLFAFFWAADSLAMRAVLAGERGENRRWIGLFAAVAAAALLWVIFGENLPEKLGRYPQFFIKTVIGAPFLAGLTAFFYVEAARKNTGRTPWVLRRAAWRVLCGGAGTGFALFLDLGFRPGEYFFIHGLFKMLAAASLYLFAADAVPALRALGRPLCAAGAVCAVLTAAFGGTSQWARSNVMTRTVYAGPALAAVGSVFDFDRDGSSAFFGGGDPDDRSGRVNRARPEIPNNGIDDNGFGGDSGGADTFGLAAPAYPAGRVPREASAAGSVSRPNVVVITLCSLRTDRTGLFAAAGSAPELKRFGREAAVFSRAYTPYPRSPYAVGGILTGLYPTRFIYTPKDRWGELPTLASVLRVNGYETAAVMPTEWFGKDLFFWGRGVDRFENGGATVAQHNSKHAVTSPEVTRRALGMIGSLKEPFFLYLFYFDPHEGYVARPDCPDAAGNAYEAEIACQDRQVGRVFDALRERGLFDRSIIVVAGDHGEEFGEHGGFFHGQKIYDELVRVVLMVRAPGVRPGVRDEPVSHVDIAPTVLGLAGFKTSGADGVDLGPLLAGGSAPAREEIFLVGYRKRGIVTDRHKLIYNLDGNFIELFDLEHDPGERINLADSALTLRKEMEKRFAALLDRYSQGLDPTGDTSNE